jgi:hypothetical protein
VPGQLGHAPLGCTLQPGIIAKPAAPSIFVIQPGPDVHRPEPVADIDQPEPVTDRHALLGVRD